MARWMPQEGEIDSGLFPRAEAERRREKVSPLLSDRSEGVQAESCLAPECTYTACRYDAQTTEAREKQMRSALIRKPEFSSAPVLSPSRLAIFFFFLILRNERVWTSRREEPTSESVIASSFFSSDLHRSMPKSRHLFITPSAAVAVDQIVFTRHFCQYTTRRDRCLQKQRGICAERDMSWEGKESVASRSKSLSRSQDVC